MQPSKNLQLIQVLRGIAALLVVFFHVTKNANEIFGKFFLYNFFSFGGAGVDIFFVLSGFIITYTSFGDLSYSNKLLPFAKKRFVRIYPTYWIVITFFLIAQLALPAFYKTHFNFNLKNILSTYFLFPGHVMVNGVSWTLSYELFFYLLFSLAFIIPHKKISYFFAIIYSVIIILISFMAYDNESKNMWINFIFYPMNIEFVMGITAAILVTKIPSGSGVLLITFGSLFFLMSGILSDHNFILFANPFNRVVLFGIPSFLIITGLVRYELSKQVNVHNILLLLGEASYSLYLLHLPLIVAFYKIVSKFNIENNFLFHLITFFLIILICFVSILFFKYVENPIINKLRQKKNNRSSVKPVVSKA